MYIIQPFILEQASETPYLYSATHAARMRDPAMVRAITDLQKYSLPIDQSELGNLLIEKGIDPREGCQFLERLRIIRRLSDYDTIAIYCSDNDLAMELADHIMQSDALRVRIMATLEEYDGSAIMVAVQTVYSFKEAQKIYNLCKKNNKLILLHSYFVYRHFVIDGIYCEAMALPDHFSALHNLAELNQSAKFRPSSWADIFFGSPISVEQSTIPTLPARPLEKMAAIFLLYNRLRLLTLSLLPGLCADDLSTVFEMNLDTGAVQRHRGLHSPFAQSSRPKVS